MFGLDSFISFLGGNAGALNVASTLFNIYAGNKKAQQTGAMYDYEAQKNLQAASITEATAQIAADKTRALGKRAGAAVTAQYGASGVDPTSGSAAVVSGELSRRVELDALNTILQGKYQAYGQRVAASEATAAATNARNSSTWSTASSLLGGLSKQAELSKWGSKAGASASSSGGWMDAGTPSMSMVG